MTEHEQECLAKFRHHHRWLVVLCWLQVLFVANHVWLTWSKRTWLAYLGMGVLLGFLVFQLRVCRHSRRKLRRYRLAIRLKDEALAAQGGLREHKAEQLEAVLAEAQTDGPVFELRTIKRDE